MFGMWKFLTLLCTYIARSAQYRSTYGASSRTMFAASSVNALRSSWSRSLSEKQCSKRYTSLVECKDANYSMTKSRLL